MFQSSKTALLPFPINIVPYSLGKLPTSLPLLSVFSFNYVRHLFSRQLLGILLSELTLSFHSELSVVSCEGGICHGICWGAVLAAQMRHCWVYYVVPFCMSASVNHEWKGGVVLNQVSSDKGLQVYVHGGRNKKTARQSGAEVSPTGGRPRVPEQGDPGGSENSMQGQSKVSSLPRKPTETFCSWDLSPTKVSQTSVLSASSTLRVGKIRATFKQIYTTSDWSNISALRNYYTLTALTRFAEGAYCAIT